MKYDIKGLGVYTMVIERIQFCFILVRHNHYFMQSSNLIYLLYIKKRSRGSSVGIAIGNELDGRGSIPSRGHIFFSAAQRPDLLWIRPDSYSMHIDGRRAKLTTHLHLVPRSRMVELYLHFLIRLHGVVLNWLSTVTTLPYLTYRSHLVFLW
jgi:hypothetical protein